MTASSVSRQLRLAGFRPLPSETTRMREGIRVRGNRSGSVYVVADFDNDRHVDEAIESLIETLDELGYAVKRTSKHIVRVSEAV